jgi:cytochrome c biogenesis factor
VTNAITLLVVALAALAVTAMLASLAVDGRRRDPQNFWRGATAALITGRRQYAGYLIHAGLYCLAIGITCAALGTQRLDTEMRVGETVVWAGRTIELTDLIESEQPDKLIAAAQLEISRAGSSRDVVQPARHFHLLQEEWTTEVAILPTWTGDFYAILHGAAGDDRVGLTLISNPMMRWIWVGGCVMFVGALAAGWPAKTTLAAASGPANQRPSKTATSVRASAKRLRSAA